MNLPVHYDTSNSQYCSLKPGILNAQYLAQDCLNLIAILLLLVKIQEVLFWRPSDSSNINAGLSLSTKEDTITRTLPSPFLESKASLMSCLHTWCKTSARFPSQNPNHKTVLPSQTVFLSHPYKTKAQFTPPSCPFSAANQDKNLLEAHFLSPESTWKSHS